MHLQGKGPKCHFFNSFFANKLYKDTGYSYDQVGRVDDAAAAAPCCLCHMPCGCVRLLLSHARGPAGAALDAAQAPG